jgi:hypothetical protein
MKRGHPRGFLLSALFGVPSGGRRSIARPAVRSSRGPDFAAEGQGWGKGP